MQEPMNGNPVQICVLAHPMVTDEKIRYKNMKTGFVRQLIGLGITQLIIGVLCLILQAIALSTFFSIEFGLDFIGHGFWTGIIFLITGPFGIVGGVKRSRSRVVAFNVLSILSASFAACLFIISVAGAIRYASPICRYHYYARSTPINDDYYWYKGYTVCQGMTSVTGVAMESMLAILGLIEGIVAIWSSAICCRIGACCCSSTPIQNQFLMTDQGLPGQQQNFIATQQQSGSNLQPHVAVPNQQLTFLPNTYSQQPMINIDPRQQVAQYNARLANLYYGQESNDNRALSQAPNDKSLYTGLYTEMRNTVVAPEQSQVCGGAESAYDCIENEKY